MILTLEFIKEKQDTLNDLINFYSYLQKKYGQKKENQELEEIKKKQEELNEMIETFEQEKEKKEELSTVWVPKNDERYFFVGRDGTVLYHSWDGSGYDKDVLETNNAFKTQEEAENHVEWLKILYELRTLGGDYWHNIKKTKEGIYTISCERVHKSIHISTTYTIQLIPLPICFKTKEQVKNAIETIGEERLKKYWFRVEG